jgi:hypothetical protein
VTKYIIALILICIGSFVLGAGMMQDYDARGFGFAFGCGRFYAGNFDPADDPRDEQSKCYPYYKAWDAQQWHPR